jgi:type VI secretion system protein VasG
MVDAILTHTLLPEISREILARLMEGESVQNVRVGVTGGEFEYAFE